MVSVILANYSLTLDQLYKDVCELIEPRFWSVIKVEINEGHNWVGLIANDNQVCDMWLQNKRIDFDSSGLSWSVWPETWIRHMLAKKYGANIYFDHNDTHEEPKPELYESAGQFFSQRGRRRLQEEVPEHLWTDEDRVILTLNR